MSKNDIPWQSKWITVPTIQTDLCNLFGIEYPIVQAAMGPTGTVELATAVSEAGGLGMVSVGSGAVGEREARESFRHSFEYVTQNTDKPFGINVPAGSSKMSENVKSTMDAYLEEVLVSKITKDRVGDQLVLLETSAGDPERWMDKIEDVKEDQDLLHFHKCGSVKHAKRAAELGVDGITASGFEMGGHTHTLGEAAHTFVLVPAVAEAVDIPVIASGGVRDGRGLLAALALGADGVYMGSRLMLTQEADFHENYKEYAKKAGPGSDTLVDGIFGPLRVLESDSISELEELKDEMGHEEFADLKDQKMIQAQQGDVEEGLVLAGQVTGYIDDIPSVEELLESIVEEAVTTSDEIAGKIS